MSAVPDAAYLLLSIRSSLACGRSACLLVADFITFAGTPLSFVVSLGLDFSILAFIALASKFIQQRHYLGKELDQARRTLGLQQRKFLALLDSSNDGILLLTSEAQILYASPAAQKIYGPADEILVGRSVLCFVHDSDRDRMVQALDVLTRSNGATVTVELRCHRADGCWHWTECKIKNLLADPAVKAIVIAYRDIEVYKKCEQDLTALAVTDALTGLANYRRLMDVLDSEIKRFDRTGRPCTILMLDLDGLKRINDTHGHLVGSRALRRIAEVLLTSCRTVDTPARYGGDEFVVVLPESNLDVARGVAERITHRLRSESETPLISVSVGIATCPDDGKTAEALLEKADVELYKMKTIYNSLQAIR
jgi:two-component system, cell cycle response regulator